MEASGKSTLVGGIAEYLTSRGVDVVRTREPGGTPLGDRLRAAFLEPVGRIDPIAEALVVNASRAQHVSAVIEPALRDGRVVLCDRFATATLAYQGYGRGVDLAVLDTLADIATRGLRPDLTVLIDVPVEISRRRVAERVASTGVSPDRLEREDVAFHTRVREGYLALARTGDRFVTLDGMQPAGELLRAACDVLAAKFGL